MASTLESEIKRRKPLGPCRACGNKSKLIHDHFTDLPLEAVYVECAKCHARTRPMKLAAAFTAWRKGRFWEVKNG